MNKPIQSEDTTGAVYTWPSRKAFTADEQALRSRATPGVLLSGRDEAIGLYALACHPRCHQKIDGAFAGITVIINSEIGRTSRAFAIVHPNAVQTDFSVQYYKMSEEKREAAAANEDYQHAERAARAAVEQSMHRARRRLSGGKLAVLCSGCGETGSIFTMHVHHHVLKFRDIWNAWLVDHALSPVISLGGGRKEFVDPEFKAAWIAFHDRHADLALVCENCNMSAERGNGHHSRDIERTGMNIKAMHAK